MCECYVIGGPFIAEDPDCPEHGVAAQIDRTSRRVEISQLLEQVDSSTNVDELRSLARQIAAVVESDF